MYMAQITREPGVCKSPQWSQFKSFEVEKLGEAALQRLIRGCESGLEIVHVGEGGRTRPCVVMHAMSPHSSHIIIPATTKDQTSQDAGRDQIKGVDKEVLPGLMFVPGPSPVKFKEVKAKSQKIKSRAEAERVRKSK